MADCYCVRLQAKVCEYGLGVWLRLDFGPVCGAMYMKLTFFTAGVTDYRFVLAMMMMMLLVAERIAVAIVTGGKNAEPRVDNGASFTIARQRSFVLCTADGCCLQWAFQHWSVFRPQETRGLRFQAGLEDQGLSWNGRVFLNTPQNLPNIFWQWEERLRRS